MRRLDDPAAPARERKNKSGPCIPGIGPSHPASPTATRRQTMKDSAFSINRRQAGLALGALALAAYPHLFKKLPYNIDKDFEVVLPLFRTFFFVCVPVNSPYKTVADLIADAKARPGKLNYGSWSVGNPVHLGSALLESLTGTKM